MELSKDFHLIIVAILGLSVILLFLNRPKQTEALFKTGTGALQGLADTGQSFAKAGTPY